MSDPEIGYRGFEEGEIRILDSGGTGPVVQWVRGNGSRTGAIDRRYSKHCGNCKRLFFKLKRYTTKEWDRARICSRDCHVRQKETPGCRVAIAQALRWHFQMDPVDIGRLMGTPHARSWTDTVESENNRPWWQRRYQKEAIEAAGKLLASKGSSSPDTSRTSTTDPA